MVFKQEDWNNLCSVFVYWKFVTINKMNRGNNNAMADATRWESVMSCVLWIDLGTKCSNYSIDFV